MSEKTNYDAVIVGGGVGGSVSAINLAKQGKKVLLIEKENTPRHKPCSGIQFPYFEKLLGVPIPKDVENTPLTKTQLTHTELEFPPTSTGEQRKNMSAAFPMSNFMRNTFDDWLNKQAQNFGAEFSNKTSFEKINENTDGTIDVTINRKGKKEVIKTKYLIGADGVNSSVRKQLRPGDYEQHSGKKGGGINYYIKPDNPDQIKIPKTTLLQIWNADFNNDMFAWVYIKDEPNCNDEKTKAGQCTDAWVVGTSYTGKDIDEIGEKLLEHVKKNYGLSGKILRKEKLKVDLALGNPEKRFAFGDHKNILYVGDAAGLIDAQRGLGMDAAALSAHKATNAILEAEKCTGENCKTASQIYTEKMQEIKNKLEKGAKEQSGVFSSNDELAEYVSKKMGIKTGLGKIFCSKLNTKFRKPENMKLC